METHLEAGSFWLTSDLHAKAHDAAVAVGDILLLRKERLDNLLDVLDDGCLTTVEVGGAQFDGGVGRHCGDGCCWLYSAVVKV